MALDEGERGAAFQVVIAGGGVAALEAALALRELAGDLVATTIVAPNAEFRYRPLLVHEPFKPAVTAGYSVAEIAERAGARLLEDSFKWLDPTDRMLHTDLGNRLHYDAVLLAIGARSHPRFRDADVLTLDDRQHRRTARGVCRSARSRPAEARRLCGSLAADLVIARVRARADDSQPLIGSGR